MSGCCPECGQALPVDHVEAAAEAIRDWCRDSGVPILLGGCIRQSDAATYLGRSSKTLSNWNGDVIPVKKVRGRAYLSIQDIAWFVVNEN